MGEEIVLFAETLLDPEFPQANLTVPLAVRLARRYTMSVFAPAIGDSVAARLRDGGVEVLDGGARFPRARNPRDETPAFLLSWAREAIARTNSRAAERRLGRSRAFRVNLTMTNSVRSDLWYTQSRPPSASLADVLPSLRTSYRLGGAVALPALKLLDESLYRTTIARTRSLYVNCRDLATFYEERGQRVDGILTAFLYPPDWGPTTATPSRDYVLVYLGKETDVEAVAELVALGYPVKAFGGKSAGWVAGRFGARPPPNLELCGAVDHRRLRELYTHARFTAFPFTDESFGLVPVESMICGTPVLTYNAQGPGETVLDGTTGWLARDRGAFVELARRWIREELPPGMPTAAQARGERYSFDSVATEWESALAGALARSTAA